MRKFPNYDAVCFHTQQCAEKYLKARLEEAGATIPKIHDLMNLLQIVMSLEPNWAALAPELGSLNLYAVAYRYPGKEALKAEAKLALVSCRVVRRAIRLTFNLPV